ncbi:MAG TPA: hypothetical protein VN965_01915, partial [Candidatus Dormibacteraeota bacterium]|nr:hypothetical protein [Candidatus Dormibacteraeota bacterium]
AYSSPCNCRNHVWELSQYLQRLIAETYDATISCCARLRAPSVKCMREAAYVAALFSLFVRLADTFGIEPPAIYEPTGIPGAITRDE